jgi:two-component system, cell cycle response regulator
MAGDRAGTTRGICRVFAMDGLLALMLQCGPCEAQHAMAHYAPSFFAPKPIARPYGPVSMTVARGGRCATDTLPPAPMGPRRILVVDDDEHVAAGVVAALHADDLDMMACAPADMLASLAVFRPDVILIRTRRDHPRALAVCCQLHDVEAAHPRTVIAYATGDAHEDAVVDALRCGADDYIANVGRDRELQARVDAQLRHLRDREVMRWARAQRSRMKDLANTDALTGIANRRAGARAIDRLLDAGGTVTLALVDVDHFKRINDAFGHPVGDLVLRGVAREIARVTPVDSTAARWGGEEFAIVLPGHEGESAEEIGERFRAAVGEVSLDDAGGTVWVTASVGVARWCGAKQPSSSAPLVAAADAALYRAKNEGRNRVSAAVALTE